MIVFDEYVRHLPLNQQGHAHEGVALLVSTLADKVGASVFALKPLYDLICDHVTGAGLPRGDGTRCLCWRKAGP